MASKNVHYLSGKPFPQPVCTDKTALKALASQLPAPFRAASQHAFEGEGTLLAVGGPPDMPLDSPAAYEKATDDPISFKLVWADSSKGANKAISYEKLFWLPKAHQKSAIHLRWNLGWDGEIKGFAPPPSNPPCLLAASAAGQDLVVAAAKSAGPPHPRLPAPAPPSSRFSAHPP